MTRDSWTGEDLVERADEETGARIFVALHSSRLGPPTGGTRMKTYPDDASARRDAMRLSEAMTYKWAAAGFPRGGGKAVIAVAPGLRASARAGLLRRYGALLAELGGRFCTGGDVGTSSSDMDVIAETGAPYVFSRTPERGGAGGSGSWTALGVFAAIEAVCERLFGDPSPRGRRAVVQGAGSVGAPLIERLAAAGARVAVADPDVDAGPPPARAARDRGHPGGGVPVRSPATSWRRARSGGILDAETIPRLRVRAIVGAANDQLAGPRGRVPTSGARRPLRAGLRRERRRRGRDHGDRGPRLERGEGGSGGPRNRRHAPPRARPRRRVRNQHR